MNRALDRLISSGRGLGPVLGLTAACALLLVNAAWRIGGSTTDELFLYWRSSDDFAIAGGYAALGEFPVAPYRVKDTVRREKDPRYVAYRQRLAEEMTDRQIEPAMFWRTLPPRSISPDRQWRAASRFDDGGRALLLGLCYRVMGGAAPFLLFWLGILIFVPLLGVLFLEFRSAGHAIAGAILAILLSSSAFVVDLLALGYSAAGFHLMSIVVLGALATYTTLGRVTVRGLLLRSLGWGVVLGVFSIARGTVPSLLPAFLLAVVIGAFRALPSRGRKAWPLALALTFVNAAMLCLPYLLLGRYVDGLVESAMTRRGRPMMPRYHDPALLIWKGLGDFDRTKGYEFRDKAGERAIIKESRTGNAERDQEIHLRNVILEDIRTDPLWYVSILAKRALSTAALYKISPFGPRDGLSMIPASSANEGVIDAYYAITTHADWYRLGRWTGELPVGLFLFPTGLLLIAALLPASGAAAPRLFRAARTALPVMTLVSLGVLASPVLITTATALEPQCFVIVHFLALAFLAEGLLKREAVRSHSTSTEQAAR